MSKQLKQIRTLGHIGMAGTILGLLSLSIDNTSLGMFILACSAFLLLLSNILMKKVIDNSLNK